MKILFWLEFRVHVTRTTIILCNRLTSKFCIVCNRSKGSENFLIRFLYLCFQTFEFVLNFILVWYYWTQNMRIDEAVISH